MSTNTLIAAVVALIVIIGGGYAIHQHSASMPEYAATPGDAVPPATDNAANASSTDASASASASVGVTVGTPVVITLTDSGFTPAKVTVKKGQPVTFVNQSKSGMWVASDPHPTHQGYSGTTRAEHCPDTDGTAFDECTVADSYTFTFQKTGSWGYHNHVIDEQAGTIVVTQ